LLEKNIDTMSTTYKFLVENIKCDGCVKSIKTELSKIVPVEQIAVDKEKGEVRVFGEKIESENIFEMLSKIGFPKRKKKWFVF
jgi:copper chaperone